MTESFLPICEENDEGLIFALTVKQNPDKQLSISILKYRVIDGDGHFKEYSSVDEAERDLLTNFDFQTVIPTYKDDGRISLDCLVLASNQIAVNSRRGGGNVIIYHPNNEKLFNKDVAVKVGYTGWKWIPTENCPEDKVVMLYVGLADSDSAFILTTHEKKIYMYHEPEEQLACWRNYGRILELTQ